jgi:hypothetical protein
MKRGLVVMMGTIAVLTAAPTAQAQGRGGGAAPACTTVQCDVLGDWGRSYALLIGEHVAGIDVKLLSTLGGKTPAPMVNTQATSKADIVAALRQVNDYGAAVLKEFNDQQLSERVASLPFMGPTASRLRVIYFSMSHSQDIYGQLVVYLRLSGITPPASNRP